MSLDLPTAAAGADGDRRPLVLHVLHHLVIGGMENGLVNLINHLPASRFRHAVACIEDFSDFRDRITRTDVEVLALRRSQVGAQGVRRAIFSLCRRLRPALVHTRALSGLDALLPARLAGVHRSVHSEHGWNVDNLHGAQWKPALLRRLHRPLVDRYITVSKDLQRFLTERIGVHADRIDQIYNGVDTVRFAPQLTRVPSPLMPEGFLGPHTVCFGSVGRMQLVKDHASLLRAVAQLLQAAPQWRRLVRLAIVGDGPMLAATRALADELGIADISWLPGSSHSVEAILRGFDVFVLPSLNEGISNTVLEAMATGLPVIASSVGGNVELVDDGRTGMLFDAGDVGCLSAHMLQCLQQPQLRLAQGQAGRQVALQRFSLDAMVARYGQVYTGLCASR